MSWLAKTPKRKSKNFKNPLKQQKPLSKILAAGCFKLLQENLRKF